MEISAYAPFVQFIAGIYLVSMYDKVLDLNPLQKQIAGMMNHLADIKNKYQGDLSDEHKTRIGQLLSKEGIDKQWKRISVPMKYVSILSFFYCLFLLFFFGMEKDAIGREQLFILPSITLIAYVIATAVATWCECKKILEFLLNANAIVVILILMGTHTLGYILFNDFLVEKELCLPCLDEVFVKKLSLLTSTFGLFLYAVNYFIVLIKDLWLTFKLRSLKSKLDKVLNYMLGVTDSLDKKLSGEIFGTSPKRDSSVSSHLKNYITKTVNKSVADILSSIEK